MGHFWNAAFQVGGFREKAVSLQVRLIRKLANALDGVDVSRVRVGDLIDVTDAEGAMLIAEGWAEPAARTPSPSTGTRATPRSES